MRRRRLLKQLPLEVDDDKRRVLLAAAAPGPGAGAHVAVDGVRLLLLARFSAGAQLLRDEVF